MASLGVLGGTFDPVHLGHIQSALALVDRCRWQTLHLVPCFQPVHKDAPNVAAEHRLSMLQVACDSYPQLFANDIELARRGPSFSIDTMAAFRESMGEKVSITMVMGADAFAGFAKWHRADDFFSLVNVLVMHRAGQAEPDLASSKWTSAVLELDDAIQCSRGALTSVQLPPWDISSTAIRSALALGQDVSHWLEPRVSQYIESQQLYR